MQTLILLGLVGLAAQLINGSLGMGYGATSTTMLLMLGTGPAAASATVNLSQVGSQLASGFAHWRFGNVDRRVVVRIAAPGAVGAFAGALLLSRLSSEAAGPLMSSILLALGLYLLLRFTLRDMPRPTGARPLRTAFLAPLGLVAGFMNSTGGGGWGPVGTTALLATGRLEPRKVIGSISVGEFAVVVAGSLGFAVGLGLEGIDLSWVGVMLLGGLLAAPVAAWLARMVPARPLGAMVGGLIVLTNTRVVLSAEWAQLPPLPSYALYAGILLAWAAAVAHCWRLHFTERRGERASSEGADAPVTAER